MRGLLPASARFLILPLAGDAARPARFVGKRKERRGEGLGLLLHASVVRLQQQLLLRQLCLAQKHSLEPQPERTRDQQQPALCAGGQ
jgi:hypothetical protein